MNLSESRHCRCCLNGVDHLTASWKQSQEASFVSSHSFFGSWIKNWSGELRRYLNLVEVIRRQGIMLKRPFTFLHFLSGTTFASFSLRCIFILAACSLSLGCVLLLSKRGSFCYLTAHEDSVDRCSGRSRRRTTASNWRERSTRAHGAPAGGCGEGAWDEDCLGTCSRSSYGNASRGNCSGEISVRCILISVAILLICCLHTAVVRA